MSCALRPATDALRAGFYEDRRKRPEDRGPRAVGRALSGMGAAWQSMFDNRDGFCSDAALAEAASGALNAAASLF